MKILTTITFSLVLMFSLALTPVPGTVALATSDVGQSSIITSLLNQITAIQQQLTDLITKVKQLIALYLGGGKVNEASSSTTTTKFTYANNPSISLELTSSSSPIYAGQTVALAVKTTSSTCAISKVEFALNNKTVSTDTSKPFVYQWKPSKEGEYNLKAVVTDCNGVAAYATKKVAVLGGDAETETGTGTGNSTTTPTTPTTPGTVPANPTAQALPTIPMGIPGNPISGGTTVAGVNATTGATTGTTTGTTTGATTGTTTGTGTAKVSKGTDTGSVSVTAQNGMKFVYPRETTKIKAGKSLSIRVAVDSKYSRAVSAMDFYIDGKKVGTDKSYPYRYVWKTTAGKHTLKAVAVGNESINAELKVEVASAPSRGVAKSGRGGSGVGTGAKSFKDGWGFQPFPIPSNVVNVSPGGDLKAAVSGGNKVVKLAAGTWNITHLNIPSNTILEGAGAGKTILKSAGGGYVVSVRDTTKNVIVRNLTVNATGNGNANGFELVYGPDNILVEDVEVLGAGKSNLIVWNPGSINSPENPSERITFNRINSHDPGRYHCISFRIVFGGQILNSTADKCPGYGVDISNSKYIEMAGNSVTNSMGTKYPAVDALYSHDNEIVGNTYDDGPGLKIQRECGPAGRLHFENNKIVDNKVQVRDWTYSCRGQSPHFAEIVWKNNEISGGESPTVAIGSVGRMEVYGQNGSLAPTKPADGDPAADGIGVSTW